MKKHEDNDTIFELTSVSSAVNSADTGDIIFRCTSGEDRVFHFSMSLEFHDAIRDMFIRDSIAFHQFAEARAKAAN